MLGIVEQRTKEELEDMARDAFADMDELLENAKRDKTGYPIVKAGARRPDADQEWY